MYRVRPQVRGFATSSLARRALLRPRCERLSDINARAPHFTTTRGIADSAYRNHIAVIPKIKDQSPKDEFIIPRISSTVTPEPQKWEVSQERKDDVFSLIDTIYKTEDQIASLLDNTGLLEEFQHVVYSEELDLVDSLRFIVGYRDEQDLLTEVSRVRQVFGDHPPTELMSDEALTAFIRLYGEPRPLPEEEEDIELSDEEMKQLMKQMGAEEKGEAAEAAEAPSKSDQEDVLAEIMEEGGKAAEAKEEGEEPVSDADLQARAEQIAQELGAEMIASEEQPEDEPFEGTAREPPHALTQEGKFIIDDSLTLTLPRKTMINGVTSLLKPHPNKHLREAAEKIFGGEELPYSLRIPRDRSKSRPLPLTASQHHMEEMEGSMFFSVLYPGMYASALSTLSEVRKRLGTGWLRNLINKEGGPSFLDAGAGGAAAVAWKDVLSAESSLMDGHEARSAPEKDALGATTVLAGSGAIRKRASKLLDNTTFVPRLPNYMHVRDGPTDDDMREPQPHKMYDVIVASHELWQLPDEVSRKRYVQNLWAMLNPEGGVLVLIEKGTQRGFEVVAGARQMILERLIASPGSEQYERPMQKADLFEGDNVVTKEKGMIVAPCTNHEKCPMYQAEGTSIGRRDYCSFVQRYHRPAYLNNILLKEKSHNHEDVQFSFVAVQRGVDLREPATKEEDRLTVKQGEDATTTAFAGYENLEKQQKNMLAASEKYNIPIPVDALKSETAHPLSLPRLVFPPLKRSRHVVIDLCTPAGKIERWSVPKSLSNTAYRAARKSMWGDLWALGAKTRLPRNLKLGTPVDTSKKADKRSKKRELRDMIRELHDQGEDEAVRRLQNSEVYVPQFERVMSKFNPQVRMTKKMIIKRQKKENREFKKLSKGESGQ